MTSFYAIQDGDFNDSQIWSVYQNGGVPNTDVPGADDMVTIDTYTVSMDGASVAVLDAGDGATLDGSFTATQSMDLEGVTVSGGDITSNGGLGLVDVALGSSPIQADSLDA